MTDTQYRVLEFISKNGGEAHYSLLTAVIYSEETRRMYPQHKLKKMTHTYLGKLCNKEWLCSGYKTLKYGHGKSYVYYKSHYLMPKGKIEFENYESQQRKILQ